MRHEKYRLVFPAIRVIERPEKNQFFSFSLVWLSNVLQYPEHGYCLEDGDNEWDNQHKILIDCLLTGVERTGLFNQYRAYCIDTFVARSGQ